MFVSTPTFDVSAYAGSTAIVVGSAPCVEEDFARALDLYPDAEIIGASSGGLYVFCDHIITKHQKEGQTFRDWTRTRWGHESIIHGPDGYDLHQFDYVWDGFKRINGSSGFAAAVLVASWGFRRVILAGIPLDGSDGYHKTVNDFLRENPAPHSGLERHHPGVVWMGSTHLDYQRKILRHRDEGILPRSLCSMSGFTREVLGGPDGNW